MIELYEKYVQKCIDYVLEGVLDGEMVPDAERLETCIPISNLSMIKQLCTLLQAIIFTAEDAGDEGENTENSDEENAITEPDQLEGVFVFCILWSIGGALNESSRVKFNDLLTKIYVEGSGKNSFFDRLNAADDDSQKTSARLRDNCPISKFARTTP
mgnify:CR=1 FL=1